MNERDVRRFWSKIDRRSKGECWPWIAKSKHWNGYGIFTMPTGKPGGKKIVSSRIACFLGNGEAPEGMPNALHSCDNTTCCNPSHLRWGAQRDNVRDAINRKRHVNPPRIWDNPEWVNKYRLSIVRGEEKANSSLTEEIVRSVWALHASHKSSAQISRTLGIPVHVVCDLCRGRSWRHLEGAPTLAELKVGGLRRGVNQFTPGITSDD